MGNCEDDHSKPELQINVFSFVPFLVRIGIRTIFVREMFRILWRDGREKEAGLRIFPPRFMPPHQVHVDNLTESPSIVKFHSSE